MHITTITNIHWVTYKKSNKHTNCTNARVSKKKKKKKKNNSQCRIIREIHSQTNINVSINTKTLKGLQHRKKTRSTNDTNSHPSLQADTIGSMNTRQSTATTKQDSYTNHKFNWFIINFKRSWQISWQLANLASILTACHDDLTNTVP